MRLLNPSRWLASQAQQWIMFPLTLSSSCELYSFSQKNVSQLLHVCEWTDDSFMSVNELMTPSCLWMNWCRVLFVVSDCWSGWGDWQQTKWVCTPGHEEIHHAGHSHGSSEVPVQVPSSSVLCEGLTDTVSERQAQRDGKKAHPLSGKPQLTVTVLTRWLTATSFCVGSVSWHWSVMDMQMPNAFYHL